VFTQNVWALYGPHVGKFDGRKFKEKKDVVGPYRHDVHTKFDENWSLGPRNITGRERTMKIPFTCISLPIRKLPREVHCLCVVLILISVVVTICTMYLLL
jgi:hypothetical protein